TRGRFPVNIEEVGELGARAILEYIEPPHILAAADPNVVWNKIHQVPETARLHRVRPRTKVVRRAELWIQLGVICNVVAVRTSRLGAKIGRGVHSADTQRGQVLHDLPRLPKCETLVKLKPVG